MVANCDHLQNLKYSQCVLRVSLNEQFPPVEIQEFDLSHDRFMIIDHSKTSEKNGLPFQRWNLAQHSAFLQKPLTKYFQTALFLNILITNHRELKMNKVADKYSKNSKLPQSESTHKMEKICTYGDLTLFILYLWRPDPFHFGNKVTENMSRDDIRKAYNALSSEDRKNVYDKWVKNFDTEDKFVDAYLKEEVAAQTAAEMVQLEMEKAAGTLNLPKGQTIEKEAEERATTWKGINEANYDVKARKQYQSVMSGG